VDIAKALGIFFVFYGHIVEQVASDCGSQGFYQFKFIYAFHVPLFFFMAGFFWRPFTKMSDQIKKLLLRRLAPVFAFAFLTFPLWLIYYWVAKGRIPWEHIIFYQAKSYLHGLPYLNFPIWFLVCLYTCEFFASLILPKLRSQLLVFFFGICTLFIGLIMCQHMPAMVRIFRVPPNTWYMYESIVSLGFYSMGYALFPRICPLVQRHSPILYTVCLLAFGVLLLTFNMNDPSACFIVLLSSSGHGTIPHFIISAFAGIIFILSLSAIMPRSSILLFIGKHSLPLLGINGFFYHFMNARLVALWRPENTFFSITICCTVLTVLSLAVSIPVAAILDRFVPQLMGKSNLEGPLLPNLENMHWKTLIIKYTGRIISFALTIIRRCRI
jgi:fucose 4-O-acetylase-like acetyltransferase